jgi:hypothetical protein
LVSIDEALGQLDRAVRNVDARLRQHEIAEPILTGSGPQGPQGFQGTQGVQGATGAQGTQGFQGTAGATGPQGTQGNQGTQGTTGATGSQGPQGFQGNQGTQGTQGVQGAQGAQGAGYKATSTTSLAIGTGTKSLTTQAGLAYSVGCRVRYSRQADATVWMEGRCTSYSGTTLEINADLTSGAGTHTDWNINLAGERGAQGTQGTQGVQGAQGTQGFQGTQGNQGSQGTQGVQGAQGFQGVAGAGGTVLIDDRDLNGLTSYTFSGISGSYKNLRLVVYGRTNAGSVNENCIVRFNGDTGNNYHLIQHYAINATPGASPAASVTFIYGGSLPAGSSTAAAAAFWEALIPYYSNTTLHKAMLTIGGNTPTSTVADYYIPRFAGRWANTAAITSILVSTSGGTFQAGSRAQLWGEV